MPPSWACCGASKEGGLVSAAGASEANVISVSESYRNFEQRQVAVGGPTPERRRGRPPESAPVLQADLRRDLPLLKIATRLSLLSYTEDVKELQDRYWSVHEAGKADGSGLEELCEIPEVYGPPGGDCVACSFRLRPPAGFDGCDILAITVRSNVSLESSVCDSSVPLVPVISRVDPHWPLEAMAHEHFQKQYQELEPHIEERIRSHLYTGPHARVLFTGHSLGASVAAIGALAFARLYPGLVWFAGMGMATPGNATFAAEFDRNVGLRWGVRYGRDVVPKIRLSQHFCHVGTELAIGPADPYPDVPFFSDLPEHFCNKYVEGIDAHTDSWWRLTQRDLRVLTPWRLHASFINSSYRLWRTCIWALGNTTEV